MHMRTCIHMYAYAYMHTCICVHAYMYTRIHTYELDRKRVRAIFNVSFAYFSYANFFFRTSRNRCTFRLFLLNFFHWIGLKCAKHGEWSTHNCLHQQCPKHGPWPGREASFNMSPLRDKIFRSQHSGFRLQASGFRFQGWAYHRMAVTVGSFFKPPGASLHNQKIRRGGLRY
jgi:hypothetical protein